MREYKYTVSISILASNRKDTLPKTLESIKPILDNVSSELIITDTGCDEDLLAFIRGYTDKIIKFQWCNDFAKARNVGLEMAQGKWFMYLDDDEWFEDVSEFIEFFNGDEKDKYGCGQYIQRNFHDFDGRTWSDAVVGRLFVLKENTRFKDAIHETLINVVGPMKNFSSYVHHYGYIYKTEEARKKHRERNEILLLQQLEKEPTVARNYAHLAQEYAANGEYDKVLEVAYKGLANSDMTKLGSLHNVPGLYGFIVWAKECKNMHEDVLREATEYINGPYCNELCEALLTSICATSACKLEKYEESMRYAERYIELKVYLDENKDIRYGQSTAMILYALEDVRAAKVAYAGIFASTLCKNMDKLILFAKERGKYPGAVSYDISGCMEKIAIMICEEVDIDKGVLLAGNLLKINQQCKELIKAVRRRKGKNDDEYMKLATVMGKTESDNGYICYLRIISQHASVSMDKLEELYAQAMSTIADIINIENEFWDVACRYNIDILSMINEIPLVTWMETVEQWAVNVKVKELIEKKQALDKVIPAESMYMVFFDMIMIEALLYRKRMDGMTSEELWMEIMDYGRTVMEFYQKIYSDITMRSYKSVLPNRCQVVFSLMDIYDDRSRCTELKGNIIKKAPRMEKILEKIIETIN